MDICAPSDRLAFLCDDIAQSRAGLHTLMLRRNAVRGNTNFGHAVRAQKDSLTPLTRKTAVAFVLLADPKTR
jgi:hypothetical protein